MSDAIVLNVTARETLGKQVKRIRADGQVPGVVHNFGKESSHVQTDYRSVAKVIKDAGRHHPVELTLDGKKSTVMIRKVDRNPKNGDITHFVLESVKANEVVEAVVPVVAAYSEGNEASPAERAGLIVLAQATELVVKAFPRNLPDQLTYDAEKLVAVGDQLTAGDITMPANVELVTEPEHVIATVFEPSALAAANDEAGGDAETGDESAVESDHESGATEGTQAGEARPGGKEEREDASQAKSPEKS